MTTLGPHRFSLMMLAEGQRSIDEDWEIIRAYPSFEAGFTELAKYAYTAGWGRWELVRIDPEARRGVFRVHNGWEGSVQRATALNWGVGLVAGKFTAFCQKLFGCNCWPRQTRFIADGDAWDELVVEPSARTVADELGALADAGLATNADLHRLLADLKTSAAARERALTERDRMVEELQDKLHIIAEQRVAIAALSTPIVQLWDEVLAVPIVGAIDAERTGRLMEKLLTSIIDSKSRFAILDVTGVEAIDAATADNFVRIIRAVQLLGAHGVLSGIVPAVAQTLVDLGVDLSGVRTFANLREALKACLAEPARSRRHA
ncbi:STAS domain-containing protein [Nannocystis punicea]|uniref:STAS domain-containing protein n=1 Tax=Nannocystis punicea TaxID=2995304 RepID=A0ABY7GTD6_9BACT|nr:STAS domain-containing protein [Nannocystis poenicansa]WAS90196.1 STAS domain-containing protein [Nannocystis poenicansa]